MIRTLLLSGANNHDWQRSTPRLKEILEATGRFAVTVTEDPPAVLEAGDPRGDWDLVVSDYNGPAWSEAAQTNFERAVREGLGFVAVHAADNAFPGWTEYETMLGLLWRTDDGGVKTGHGEFHAFDVNVVDPNHPIADGVPPTFEQWDELYHHLRWMHGTDYRVIASAWSDPDRGGSGRHEPMAVVTRYGAGRVYHHVPGHVWAGEPSEANRGASLVAFESEGFQRLLVNGCAWAASA